MFNFATKATPSNASKKSVFVGNYLLFTLPLVPRIEQ